MKIIEDVLKDFYNSLMLLEQTYAKLKSYQDSNKDKKPILLENNNNLIRLTNRYTSQVEKKEKIAPAIKEQIMKIHGVTIYKNKKCNSYYTRKRINGKQLYITAKTQKAVVEQLKSLLNIEKIDKTEHSLINWYKEWLSLYKINNVKNTTISDYKKSLKHIPEELLYKNIKNIKINEIINLLNSIDKERAKQKVYELLKSIFEKAKIHKIIKDNIFDFIQKPKHIKDKGIALDFKQQQLFLKCCNNSKYGELFKIILFQGLRIGEALALNNNDINLKNNTITINKSLTQENLIDSTKNKQSIREMPIFEPSKKILKNLTKANNERLFNFSYNTIQKQIKQIIKNSELPNISIHDLRHTFITNCQNENIPEHIIQNWVGHEIGSKVTKQVYTHTTNDVNLFNINKLNKSKFYSNSTHE